MQRSISKLMLLCATLVLCLPATAPTHAHALSLSQRQNAPARASALSQVAHLEASVHAVGVSGTLAYAVVDSNLHVLDISNPAQPARLTSIALQDQNIYNLQIADNRVYLTSVEGVLRIVDIRNPLQPVLLSTQNLDLTQLRVIGNLAYAIVQGGSLRVFDVSNPFDLQLRGSYAPTPYFYATDLQVVNGVAYVTTFYSGFQIVDLRDLNRPRLLSGLPNRYDRISINSSRAYLIRYTDDGLTYLDIIDISQPSRPKRLGSLQTSTLRELQASGSLVYALGDDGLHLIDVNQPAAPRQVAVYTSDIYPLYFQTTTIAVVRNLVFVVAGELGLQIIDAANPAVPILRGQYITFGFASDVQIAGNVAYVTSSTRLQIFDISDPARPTQRGSYLLHVGIVGLQVRGNFAYVAYTFVPTSCCQYGVMEIIDISDPAHPLRRGSFTTNGINDLQVVDQRVYLTGRTRLGPTPVLAIVDVSNPNAPTQLGSYGGNCDGQDFGNCNSAAAVDIAGSLAYVADRLYGLKIIDVSNPVSPTLHIRLDMPGSASDIQIANGLAYIADGDAGLQIVDISNPSSPTVRGSMPTIDDAVGVRVVGNQAYIAAGDSGVQVVDVSDPSRPIPRARYDTPGYARRVDVVGDKLYVADQAGGLQILKLAPLPSVSASVAPSGGTLVSPDDATSYTFAAGTFASTVTITHTIHFGDAMPATGSLAGGQAFDIQARDGATGQQCSPPNPTASRSSTARPIAGRRSSRPWRCTSGMAALGSKSQAARST